MSPTLLCAGLSVLGLCVPLPGHSRAMLEAADWHILSENGEQSITTTLTSGTYQLALDISFDAERVRTVLLIERGESSHSPLEAALARACKTANGGEVCSSGSARFVRMPCEGGVLLLLASEKKEALEQQQKQCAKWAPVMKR
ncbi:MAG: hypothetical protein U0228_17815 [Myxococcaceae bacterium]